MVERGIKEYQLWNMDDTGFIHKQNSCKVLVSNGSSNMWSNSDNANFHMAFVICVSAAKYFAPPLLILPGNRLNWDVLGGCDIEVSHVTTAPKVFINSTLFLN